jgi:hypothetical protein
MSLYEIEGSGVAMSKKSMMTYYLKNLDKIDCKIYPLPNRDL